MSDNVFRVPSPGEIDEQGDVMMRLADELRDTVLPFVVRIRELLEEARAADTECVGRLKVLRDNASQAEAQYAYYEENVRRSKELLEKYRDTKEKIQRLMWCDGKPLNFDAANIPRTQDLPVYYNEVSAAYVFTKETFLRLHRRIGEHPFICEVSGAECIDIDYPEDFEIANAVYMQILKKKEKL